MTVRHRHSLSPSSRCRTVVIAALFVALSGCARFASSGSSSGVPAASSPIGIERDCGRADDEACDRIVKAAVRAGSVDGQVSAVQVTTEHAPSFGPCPSGPCPTLFPDLWAGAIVTLAGGKRIDVSCHTYANGLEDLPVIRDFPMLCAPAKAAEQHIAGVYTKERNRSGTWKLWLGMLSGASGNGSAVGRSGAPEYGCGYVRLSVPFSFYLSDIVAHAPSNEEGGSGPAGEMREVFRSEDIGNRDGDLYFRVVILGPSEIRVEETEPFTVESCAGENAPPRDQ